MTKQITYNDEQDAPDVETKKHEKKVIILSILSIPVKPAFRRL
jgi:hypothetical protein